MKPRRDLVSCTCEELPHGDLGVVEGDERLARLLTEMHFNRSGRLKPSAFPLSHIQGTGLSLVRVDKVDADELGAIAADIRQLSSAEAEKGALLGSAESIRRLELEGNRALCVKDDPVLNDVRARDNAAHAVSIATRRITEEDAKEIRDKLLELFTPVESLASIYAGRSA